MDNQDTGSNELGAYEAASLIGNMLDPEPEKKQEAQEVEQPVELQEEQPQEQSSDEPEQLFTVKIDGKEVQVPLKELTDGYQRQSDYTRKTMEVAEQRKAAEAEQAKTLHERHVYAQGLMKTQAALELAIQAEQQTDWDALLQSDPLEFMRQQHLSQRRQASLQQNQAEQQRLAAQFQAEQAQRSQTQLKQQQDELLAKLPEWKDESKAKADKAAISEYLISQGYGADDVGSISDARAVVLARKAMLYDQMVSKAQAAAKKVQTLPTKVERPGAGESQNLDKRTQGFQRLAKSGRVEDAASVIAGLL